MSVPNTPQRKVLLGGASRGIGKAIREQLLAEGHEVWGLARHPQRPEIDAHSDRYHPVPIDLSDLKNIGPTVKKVLQAQPEIDTLISNQGAPCFAPLENFSEQDIHTALDLNLRSHILLTKSCLAALKKQKHSDVILMGSESSLQGGPQGTLYCAAKFALRGFAQALRIDNAKSGMRVCCIMPGMVRSDFFNDLNFRPASSESNAIEPNDVAEAVSMVLGARPGTVFDELVLSPQIKSIEFGAPK